MTYKVQKIYYENTNSTRVRLYQAQPLRDFEVMIDGNLENLPDNQVINLATTRLAREFNPSYALEEMRKEFDEQKEIVNKVLNLLVLNDLTEEQKDNIISQYKPYQVGKLYKEKDKFAYNGKVYEVIQSHTSQADWLPDKTESLYKLYFNLSIKTEEGEIEVIADFIQPTGAHDTYKKGDKVRYQGLIYVSLIDNNAYSPADHPDGWEEVEVE